MLGPEKGFINLNNSVVICSLLSSPARLQLPAPTSISPSQAGGGAGAEKGGRAQLKSNKI